MRFKNSMINSCIVIVYFFVNLIMGMILKNIFLKYLGAEFNGLNSLFGNIISMLSIAELGIGSAIVFHLYHAIASDNIVQIKSLMSFYKKLYRLIAIIIFLIGICIVPFIPKIVGEGFSRRQLTYIFLLYLFNAVFSYLFTYNRSIIIANQKNYIITICDIFYRFLLSTVQIILIIFFKSFILYLLIQIIFTLTENVVISYIALKQYPFLKNNREKKLPNHLVVDIKIKVKGLFFHKIANFIVLGTDNILISAFCGVISVGMYNNYMLLINNLSSIIALIMNSIIASVGNLIATSSEEQCYLVYKRMILVQGFVVNMICIIFAVSIQPFIKLWIGEQYLLDYTIVLVIICNFFIQSNRKVISAFKESAGIFHEDRFVPIFESILNFIFSIVLGKAYGILGIIIATIISTGIVYLYSYPRYVYRRIFGMELKRYYWELANMIILFIVTIIGIYPVCKMIDFANLYLTLVMRIIMIVMYAIAVYYFIYRDSLEFKYWKDKLFFLWKKSK